MCVVFTYYFSGCGCADEDVWVNCGRDCKGTDVTWERGDPDRQGHCPDCAFPTPESMDVRWDDVALYLYVKKTYPIVMAVASPMTPTTPMISCPVRVLLITRPTVLDYYQPRSTTSAAGDADTTLIYLVSKQMTGSEVDPKLVHHLITRVAARVWIVFDFGDVQDRCEPPVRAFNVKLDRSGLSVTRYEHPQIENVVNATVEISKNRRLAFGVDFPSRTDLRKHQAARDIAKG